jgi:hypothetical protein
MSWKYYWRDIVRKHRVIIRGWPANIPFANLSDISSALPTLEALLRKWEQGTVFWESISDEAFKDLNEQRDVDIESGVMDEPGPRKERKDKGTKRAAVPAQTQAVAQVVPENMPLTQAGIGPVAPDVLIANHSVPLHPNIDCVPHTVINHIASDTTLPAEQPIVVDNAAFDGGDLLSLDTFPHDILMATDSNPEFAIPEFQGLYDFHPFSDVIFAQMAGAFDMPPYVFDPALSGGTTDLNTMDFTSLLNDALFDTGPDSQL